MGRILHWHMTDMKRDLCRTRNLCFSAKSNSAGARCEMDGNCCENYFLVQLFSNLPPESVVVVDSSGNRSRKEMLLAKS
jgi:hypothetical protein